MPFVKISGMPNIVQQQLLSDSLGVTQACYFALYRGVPPLFKELELATSFAASAFRQADRIIGSAFDTKSIQGHAYKYETFSVLAERTAFATWFMLCGVSGGSVIDGALVGDVGLSGVGGVLQIDTVDFVQGQRYNISKILLNFPYSFTY